MRKLLIVAVILGCAAVPVSAQSKLNLDIPGLAGLSDRASEVVDVTLDASMLRMASKFLSNRNGDERAVRGILEGLKGVYVRSYEFEREGEYDRSVLDRVRSQLGSNWKKIVNVRSKRAENVEVFTELSGDNVIGLVVICSEPRELTIVNIVGPVDLDKLSKIEGHFGIPSMAIKKERDQ